MAAWNVIVLAKTVFLSEILEVFRTFLAKSR